MSETHDLRRLGADGPRVSPLGFGGYRVDDHTPAHREALLAAIAAGCTLIDTSTNYTDGGSESLIGEVLEDLERRDAQRRRGIVVVSKIGYVQGANLELAMERERGGAPFPDMVRYMDGCWHCIHPEFLKDQMERSMRRLRLRSLDVCLLHNPEYFLTDAHRRGVADLETTRAAFYARLSAAFAFLEEKVRDGTLRSYGVSSNSAVAPAGDPEATSVSRMLQAAEKGAGPGHHFRVLQIPMNLFESGGALTANTGPDGGLTALDAARFAGLGVLINRPLNAFVDGRLVRLGEPHQAPAGDGLDILAARLDTMEKEYLASIAPHAGASDGVAAADQLFRMAEEVTALEPQVEDELHWQQIEQHQILPRVHWIVTGMARDIDPAVRDRWSDWWGRCLPVLQGLLDEIGRRAAGRGRRRAGAIHSVLAPTLPAERRDESLSRLALWVLASTPGVTCVLVGMRRPAYVGDAMGMLNWPPHPDPIGALRVMQEAAPGT